MRCPASPATSKRSRFQRPETVASVRFARCWQLTPSELAKLAPELKPAAGGAAGDEHAFAMPFVSAIFVNPKLVTLEVKVTFPTSIHAPPLNKSTDETTITRHGRATPPPSHAPAFLLNCTLIRVCMSSWSDPKDRSSKA